MKFRKLRMVLLRIRLKTRKFYKNIIFENKSVSKKCKRSIANWIFNLQYYRQIKVENFRDLFSQLNEIVFPITIQKSYSYFGLNIIFLDNEGKEYYMIKENFYDDIETYIIGRRNSSLEPLIDRDFHYKISKDGTIMLMETGAMLLKKDGKNDGIVVDFSYNAEKHTTKVKLKSYTSKRKICIEYPTKNDKFDKMVLRFLFNIYEKTEYYYNVFPILKMMLQELATEKVSISITAESEGEICSEVEVVNGIVKKYTQTKIINEREMTRNKNILEKDLKDFFKENS